MLAVLAIVPEAPEQTQAGIVGQSLTLDDVVRLGPAHSALILQLVSGNLYVVVLIDLDHSGLGQARHRFGIFCVHCIERG